LLGLARNIGNTKKIADVLKKMGISKPRGGTYTEKDISMFLNRKKKQEERLRDQNYKLKSLSIIKK
jgi:hypothetical protein